MLSLIASAVRTTYSGDDFGLPSGPGGFTTILNNIANALLALVATTAVLFIIIGAFQYVLAAGNEEGAEKGKKSILWAIRGLIFAILSWSIVNILTGSTPLRTATQDASTAITITNGSCTTLSSVKENSLVTWTNADTSTDIAEVKLTVNGLPFSSGALEPGGRFTYTFPLGSSTGTYQYSCHKFPAAQNPALTSSSITVQPRS